MAAGRDAIIAQVEKGEINESTLASVGKATVKAQKKLADLADRVIVASYVIGATSGLDDVKRSFRRGGKPVPEELQFAEHFAEELPTELPILPPKAAIAAAANQTPLTKSALATMRKAAGLTAATDAEDADAALAKKAKDRLREAIAGGQSFETWRENFTTDAEEWAGSAFDQGDGPLPEHRLENMFRTSTMTAYNNGREALFNHPDVADFIVAFQYSAILDGDTRPEHAAMDGKVFAKGSPVWPAWNPPNGFRCRCEKIPITTAETLSKDDVSTTLPMVGGERVAPDEGFGRLAA